MKNSRQFLALLAFGLTACAPAVPRAPAITPANLDQVTQITRLGRGTPLHIAWSPDGKFFALTTAIGVYLYNDRAEEQRLLETNASGPSAFSPDGKLLASAGENYTVKLWDTAAGEVIRSLSGHTDRIQSLAFSPDGRLLASGSADNTITLWQITDGTVRKILKGGAHLSPHSLAFSPDSQTLASTGPGALVLWNAATGEVRLSVTSVENLNLAAIRVAYSPDGKTVAVWGGRSGAVYWFDAANGNLQRKLAAATSFACAADGRMLATGGDVSAANKINIWAGDRPDTATVKVSRQADFGLVLDLAFKPDSSVVASLTQDNIIRFWNTADGTVIKSFNQGVKGIDGVAFSPDGRTAAAAGPGGVDQWDIAAGDVLRALDAPSRWLMCVVFAPDGRTIFAGERGDEADIWRWDIAEEKNFRLLKRHTTAVRALAYSPDGRRLASGGWDTSVVIWNMTNYQAERIIRTEANVYSLAFSPDGTRLAVGQVNGALGIWDAATGNRPLLTFSGHTEAVTALAFSPDGQTLISAGGWDNSLRFWNAASGELRQTVTGNKWIGSLAVSPDGRLVVTGEAGGLIQIRDPQSGDILRTLTGHTAEVVDLDFDRTGAHLLSGSNDGTLRVWGIK